MRFENSPLKNDFLEYYFIITQKNNSNNGINHIDNKQKK